MHADIKGFSETKLTSNLKILELTITAVIAFYPFNKKEVEIPSKYVGKFHFKIKFNAIGYNKPSETWSKVIAKHAIQQICV